MDGAASFVVANMKGQAGPAPHDRLSETCLVSAQSQMHRRFIQTERIRAMVNTLVKLGE